MKKTIPLFSIHFTNNLIKKGMEDHVAALLEKIKHEMLEVAQFHNEERRRQEKERSEERRRKEEEEEMRREKEEMRREKEEEEVCLSHAQLWLREIE